MKLTYERIKGSRFKKRFSGFSSHGYWWNEDLNKWQGNQEAEFGKYTYSSNRYCKSIRAFRRMLKTAPKGVKFELNHTFVKSNVFGKGDGEYLSIDFIKELNKITLEYLSK